MIQVGLPAIGVSGALTVLIGSLAIVLASAISALLLRMRSLLFGFKGQLLAACQETIMISETENEWQ